MMHARDGAARGNLGRFSGLRGDQAPSETTHIASEYFPTLANVRSRADQGSSEIRTRAGRPLRPAILSLLNTDIWQPDLNDVLSALIVVVSH